MLQGMKHGSITGQRSVQSCSKACVLVRGRNIFGESLIEIIMTCRRGFLEYGNYCGFCQK